MFEEEPREALAGCRYCPMFEEETGESLGRGYCFTLRDELFEPMYKKYL